MQTKLNSKNRKSQLMIFVIIGFVVFFLTTYIFFSSFSKNPTQLNEDVADSQNNLNSNILPIKNTVDFCLERQLKRALIISGLKGGFIYDLGEYYGLSSIPEGTYNDDFIANMNLNWNSLLFKALIHSQAEVYTPKLYDNVVLTQNGVEKVIYSHSIEDDFKRFILEEMSKCMNLEKFTDKGINLRYQKYSGNIISIDQVSGIVKVSEMQGNIGDNVEVMFPGKILNGIIVDSGDFSTVKLNPEDLKNTLVSTELTDIFARNLNSNVSVDVVFSQESVTAKFSYPITIIGNNFQETFKTSVTKADVRFKLLLDLSEFLARGKYFDRKINLLDDNQIYDLLEKNNFPSNINLTDIQIFRTATNDSELYKKYTYSIVDTKNKILGNPYVFNFGYENEAPKVDLTQIGGEVANKEEVLFLVAKDQVLEANLREFTSDNQAIDNFYSYYLEDSYRGADGSFSISSNGDIYFVGKQEKKYLFPLTLTDGETTRTQQLIFLTGFPDNSDNQIVDTCVKVYNYGIPNVFPISDSFNGDIYAYSDNVSAKKKAFAYTLYMSEDRANYLGQRNSELYFDKSCYFSFDYFDVEAKLTYLDNQETMPLEINKNTSIIILPRTNREYRVEISVFDKKTGQLMTEEYKTDIYPASCLGPEPFRNPNEIEQYGGSFSCCDTSQLYKSIVYHEPKNFAVNNIIKKDEKVIDSELYFCMDFSQINTDPYLDGFSFSFQNENIWKKIGSGATSLYKGRAQAICNGINPVGSLSQVTSSNNDLQFTASKFSYGGTTFDSSASVSLDLVQKANVCEFCRLETPSPLKVYGGDDFVLYTGFASENAEKSGVGPLPVDFGLIDVDDVFVTCDDEYYASEYGYYDSSLWSKDFNGEDGNPSRIYISKGYCYQGTPTCSGRPYSPTFRFKTDTQPTTCTDWYYDRSQGSFLNKLNNGWSCGYQKTCQNGECLLYTPPVINQTNTSIGNVS